MPAKAKAARAIGKELMAFVAKHGDELKGAAVKDATHVGKLAGRHAMEGLKKIGKNYQVPLATAAGTYGAARLAGDDDEDEAPPKKPKKKKRPYMEKEE